MTQLGKIPGRKQKWKKEKTVGEEIKKLKEKMVVDEKEEDEKKKMKK